MGVAPIPDLWKFSLSPESDAKLRSFLNCAKQNRIIFVKTWKKLASAKSLIKHMIGKDSSSGQDIQRQGYQSD